MSHLGMHIDPPMALIPVLLAERDCKIFQTTLRDPRRLSKEGIPDADDQAAFRTRASAAGGLWGIAHASMLTSLGSPDPRIRNGSASALVSDANLAADLGLSGVCFHVGYQKGHDSREAALDAVVYKLTDVISRLKPGARVLLENGCEGSELGQTIDEIGYVVNAIGASPDRLGVVLDTCHLHVAGFDLTAPNAPNRLAEEIEAEGLTPYLLALHLNDAQSLCGSHRDRHAAPGEGTIGIHLRFLIEHPLFEPLPAILEMGLDAASRGIEFLNAG